MSHSTGRFCDNCYKTKRYNRYKSKLKLQWGPQQGWEFGLSTRDRDWDFAIVGIEIALNGIEIPMGSRSGKIYNIFEN